MTPDCTDSPPDRSARLRRHAKVLLPALVALLAPGLTYCGQFQPAEVKNVIVMVADGSGANTIAATGMYAGRLGQEVFDRPEWTRSWASTYPLRLGSTPRSENLETQQDEEAVYDPARYWDTTPVTTEKFGMRDFFRAYRWHKDNAPDSANSFTAVMTGTKTYDGAVNVDGNGKKLSTFAEHMAAAGKSVGVVTTVAISDATPAVGGGAHNVSRANRPAIAREMFGAGILSVVMGAGNPEYDNDGKRRPAPDYEWISQEDWRQLNEGTHPGKFALIQTKEEFEALAGSASPPAKLAGIARAHDATQSDRAGARPATEEPYSVPRREDVPSLSAMVKGALNILDANAKGMFLVIEGGAVDRAMHGNNIGRMIEEKIEFDEAVAAVASYLDANTSGNNWTNTLVIVTADHDHLLLGPNSDTIPFQDLKDNGVKKVPGHRWHSAVSHSNLLVPVYARGPRADMLASCARKEDAYTDAQGRNFGRGRYIDQTQIFAILDRGACQ
jgi:alkaline phosphatase